MPATNIYINNK